MITHLLIATSIIGILSPRIAFIVLLVGLLLQ